MIENLNSLSFFGDVGVVVILHVLFYCFEGFVLLNFIKQRFDSVHQTVFEPGFFRFSVSLPDYLSVLTSFLKSI